MEYQNTGVESACKSEHGPDEKKGFRARFGRGPGVSVLGWPSKGGVYVLEQCFAVELDFLQLDRFQDTPPSSLTGFDADIEEEAHCNRMRQLGATWWRSEFHWKMGLITESVYPNLDITFIKIGWPAGGGVWVLNITDDEAFHRGAGIIYNAYDMEERCRMIKQLGGVFYENPKDWLDLDLP
ncbi:uncharacterized protein TRIVIDRAFT_69992 [Trichoderma virens Gv29-8]|uniref:Uncharacterized protein n=1 Tax=Hypocrea virens (strain Gv29-8 / FGSC 10586) TaxID=413071 RepID=G9MX47_HYPVG|nr:uncharacterized protein TRIVIDRAFT_69992 [Trichoderma virens Gv29-8]EHK20980.1 hypothetical protein TRIVIDRAFT_69992 [Trichoderma virens Gv29-8]UKZ52325.1 hypothetical protein TrVGV298_006100 [Trichoderma virens]